MTLTSLRRHCDFKLRATGTFVIPMEKEDSFATKIIRIRDEKLGRDSLFELQKWFLLDEEEEEETTKRRKQKTKTKQTNKKQTKNQSFSKKCISFFFGVFSSLKRSYKQKVRMKV